MSIIVALVQLYHPRVTTAPLAYDTVTSIRPFTMCLLTAQLIIACQPKLNIINIGPGRIYPPHLHEPPCLSLRVRED